MAATILLPAGLYAAGRHVSEPTTLGPGARYKVEVPLDVTVAADPGTTITLELYRLIGETWELDAAATFGGGAVLEGLQRPCACVVEDVSRVRGRQVRVELVMTALTAILGATIEVL